MVHQSADGERHSMAPMLFGLRAVMLGRQGSGKGTQGVQLARLLVVPHIFGRRHPPRCRRVPDTGGPSDPADDGTRRASRR